METKDVINQEELAKLRRSHAIIENFLSNNGYQTAEDCRDSLFHFLSERVYFDPATMGS